MSSLVANLRAFGHAVNEQGGRQDASVGQLVVVKGQEQERQRIDVIGYGIDRTSHTENDFKKNIILISNQNRFTVIETTIRVVVR